MKTPSAATIAGRTPACVARARSMTVKPPVESSKRTHCRSLPSADAGRDGPAGRGDRVRPPKERVPGGATLSDHPDVARRVCGPSGALPVAVRAVVDRHGQHVLGVELGRLGRRHVASGAAAPGRERDYHLREPRSAKRCPARLEHRVGRRQAQVDVPCGRHDRRSRRRPRTGRTSPRMGDRPDGVPLRAVSDRTPSPSRRSHSPPAPRGSRSRHDRRPWRQT